MCYVTKKAYQKQQTKQQTAPPSQLRITIVVKLVYCFDAMGHIYGSTFNCLTNCMLKCKM